MMQVQLNTSFPHPLLIPHWTELVMTRETLDGVVGVERHGPLTTSRASGAAWIVPTGKFQRMEFQEPPTRNGSLREPQLPLRYDKYFIPLGLKVDWFHPSTCMQFGSFSLVTAE